MNQEPHEIQEPLAHSQEDDSPEAFAERIRQLYGIEKTSLDELVELATTEPHGERFEVFLDDLTYEALTANPDFEANKAAMTSGKLTVQEQVEIRDRQRGLFSQYREAIVQEAGLPTEAGVTEAEKSKQRIEAILEQALETYDPNKPADVLEALGIITHDKDGNEIFTYPTGLFPSSTDNKWLTYIENVKNHLRVDRAVRHGTLDKSEVKDADSVRVMAHNAITRDIHDLLGLYKLPDSKWDFEKTRRLVAKMRDSRFPTVQTGEKLITSESVIEGVIGTHALKALRIRLSDMHK